ncbi:MAG: peptidase U32 [Desulfobulbus propionicus]|nr:MAG: peptidase U32 [Desulfobulbus propionicus]
MVEQQRLPELLAPAGSLDKMISAIHYGADAVYLGESRFSLRAHAATFSGEELEGAVAYAHTRAVKVFATVNIFAHNRDLEGLETYLYRLAAAGVDAIIVADPGILALCRRLVPQVPIHLSTQANVTNAVSARFWAEQGVRRLNLARELSLAEIRAIREAVDIELEVFIHGAVCISYSGRCMLSNYMTGRDANKGDCAQPCRYSYRLEEEKRPGQFFPVEEDEHGTYIFNANDLCLLRHLPELAACGVDAIKIEGRMKSAAYVSEVVRVYRAALNWLAEKKSAGLQPGQLTLPSVFYKEIEKIGTRGLSEHFFSATPSSADMLYDTMRIVQKHVSAAIVYKTSPLLVDVKNELWPGDELEYLGPEITPIISRVKAIRSAKDLALQEKANPGTRVFLEIEPLELPVTKHSLFRKRISQ